MVVLLGPKHMIIAASPYVVSSSLFSCHGHTCCSPLSCLPFVLIYLIINYETRVPLMSMPTVLGFLPAQPGSQSSPAMSSRQASVILVSSSGAAAPAVGSDSRTLLGSPGPPPSLSASASQPTARVSRVLFEGSSTASAASSSA